MDPDEALTCLRAWADAAVDGEPRYERGAAEQFRALDDWLRSGGFLPLAWGPVRCGFRMRKCSRPAVKDVFMYDFFAADSVDKVSVCREHAAFMQQFTLRTSPFYNYLNEVPIQ